MKKIVLVTGGSGFVGRAALPILLEKGCEVHAVSRSSKVTIDGVTWHHTDLLDAKQRSALIKKIRPTHILHFAWIATPGVYWTSPENEDWKTATLDLLSLARKYGVQRFVGAGSCAEYDWSNGTMDEVSTPLHPSTPYGRAKATCGTAVIAEKGISTAWGRIFHLYGPHEDRRRFVPSVTLALLAGERAKCTHGAQIRDFLHVTDVASAFVALLFSSVTGAVHIGSGTPVTLREVAETISRKIGTANSIDFGAVEAPLGDLPLLIPIVRILQKEVGWEPTYSIDTGLSQVIEFWKSYHS